MKKVLIITYYWPPSGGAGVQRWLKFSKYLPEYGWEPVILTVDPAYATYPAIDSSLVKEVPEGIMVFKTAATDWFRIYSKDKAKVPAAGFAVNADNTLKGRISRFIRGNFFIPDPRRGWNRYAIRKATEIINDLDIRHVITTSPPHSTQLIGLKLKKRFQGIRWIADLRDPWTDIYYYNQFYHMFPVIHADRKYEINVLRRADHVITVGRTLKDLFNSKLPGTSGKIQVVTNGFDEDDFKGLQSSAPEIFTISYIGTLSDSYPVEGFTGAIAGLLRTNIKMIVRFIGSVPASIKATLLSTFPPEILEFINYVSHTDAIRYMLGSSALLLIIPDHRSNKSIVTGKLFEYLACNKPVICIGPTDGDAADIIRESGAGATFSYEDSPGITGYIKKLLENNYPEGKDHEKYSRKYLAGLISGSL